MGRGTVLSGCDSLAGGGGSLGKAWSQSTGCSECVIRYPGCSSSTFALRGSFLAAPLPRAVFKSLQPGHDPSLSVP